MKKNFAYLVLAGTIIVGMTATAFAAETKAAPAAAPAAAVPEEPATAKVGDAAPEMKLKNAITGEESIVNKEFKGTMAIVVFMNTGCSSCLAEVLELNRAFGENKNVKLVAIAVDKKGEEVVRGFSERNKINATYFVDPGFMVPPQFGFEYTPALFLLDANGKIVFMKGGFNPNRDQGKLVAELKKFIKG